MKRKVRFVSMAATCLFTGLLLSGGMAVEAQELEALPVLKASGILPPKLFSGPSHRVVEKVLNDGYLNHYKIETKFAVYPAVSTAKLRKRIREAYAIEAMERVKGTEEYAASIKEAGMDALVGMRRLISRPMRTVYGAVSGAALAFRRAGDSIFGDKRSDAEESRLKDLVGFSKTKREYAYQFGVDVYTRNKHVQDRLDEIAWAGYAGGLTMGAAMSAIPGGAGLAVTISGSHRLLNEVFRTTAPSDLRRLNRKKLDAMGVNPDITDLFMNNTVFTPREQTLLVAALDEMKGTANRNAFVKFAVPTKEADMALFRQRQVEMYAGYQRNVERIERFVLLGRFVAARTGGGKLVFISPLDHLVWSRTIDECGAAIDYRLRSQPWVKERHLWVTGTVSPFARSKLEQSGWKIHEKSEERLFKRKIR